MMANEETTLERIKKFQAEAGMARAKLEEAEERIGALSAGTSINIDNMVVKLLPGGRVQVGFPPLGGGDREFHLSERQFLGLMGWGRKHVGDGPDGKSKDEPESR